MLARIALLTQLVAVALGAIGPQSTLHIANEEISPDGNPRAAVLAGAGPDSLTFPGPVIWATKGDKFALNVVDALTDSRMLRSTSIHWHGFLQAGSAWADGPVGVTQCPIEPGNSFLYEFDGTHQAGTFWYHSHDRSQYCDGLRGAMVVRDPEDPHLSEYDVDNEETVITLSDWYHGFGPDIEKLGGAQQAPQSTLINGKGQGSHQNAPKMPLAVIAVQQNKRYRFRVVSMSCSPFFDFSIDGHDMKIIEADGENTKPLVVDSIQIHPGQRYSVVVETNKEVGNYWVRANPNRGTRGFLGGINSAVLRYEGAEAVEPPAIDPPAITKPFREQDLRALTKIEGLNEPVFETIEMPIVLNVTSSEFFFGPGPKNGTFVEPTVPVLLQILNGRPPLELLPSNNIRTLEPNRWYELVIPGGGIGSPHPMHLHGHVFSVVRSAGVTTTNLDDPVRRDVVNAGASTADRVTIRFKTDNPGPWILHCHIDWHLVHGLAYVFAEDTGSIAKSDPPAAWDQLCPAAA